ncbi:aGPT-Pplase1 domain-containing protein [Microbacterium phage Morrigan]|nr:aGPT-Pplase1 domain-containing protein [Microbacterium phage Morrigan]
MDFGQDTVIKFAKARHRLWEGKPVKSQILPYRKFTNVFRVLDRGSQYLISLMNVHDDPIDRLAVSYFYRQINRPDTMDAIIAQNDGYVPEAADIFNPDWYDKVVLPVVQARPGAFLNGAYIILIKPSDPRGTYEKMRDVFPAAAPWLGHVADVTDLATRVMLLQETPGLGPFLAMQIATDLGYGEGEVDQENSYILAGPGSRKGVGYMLGKSTPATPMEAVMAITRFPVEELPPLPGSNGRPASLMDIQNVFCEYSKYVRLVQQGYKGTGKPYQRNGEFETVIPSHFIQ